MDDFKQTAKAAGYADITDDLNERGIVALQYLYDRGGDLRGDEIRERATNHPDYPFGAPVDEDEDISTETEDEIVAAYLEGAGRRLAEISLGAETRPAERA